MNKETKDAMLVLPMVTAPAGYATNCNQTNEEHPFPHSGRFIISRDNGDISICDIVLNEEGTLINMYEVFVGQPPLLRPDEWTMAVNLENLKNAHEAELTRMKQQHAEELERIEQESRRKNDAALEEMVRRDKQQQEQRDRELAEKKKDLDHEYEMRRLQLEADTPKRFAQGEWVSGKTLTEIVRILSDRKTKED